MTVEIDKERYIGDGVYASFDGYQIWLRVPREFTEHYVALEPTVFAALLVFKQDVDATIKAAHAAATEEKADGQV